MLPCYNSCTLPFSAAFQQRPHHSAYFCNLEGTNPALFHKSSRAVAKATRIFCSISPCVFGFIGKFVLCTTPSRNHTAAILLVLNDQSTKHENGCQNAHEQQNVVVLHLELSEVPRNCPTEKQRGFSFLFLTNVRHK
jgi:hypothetical protein